MNIKDLKYLVALANHQHFGRAAESCFVSQPALSMQIKKLEDMLGVKLLERTNKSLLFTETGLLITDHAREILHKVDELHKVAELANDPYSGELKIGIFPTLAPYFLPLIIPALTNAFPKLSLFLIEEQTANLIDNLKTGKLDAAFLALPISEPMLTSSLLFDEEFMLAAPANHTLSKLSSINQQHLSNLDLLLLDEGHCMREQALALCHKINAREAQSFRATSLETLRHMIAAGNGITLMPKLACHGNDGSISYIPFSTPKPVRSIGLVRRTSAAKHKLLDELTISIKKIIKNNKSIQVQ